MVENDQLYFVRTDHIGRPVFATDDTGTKVWEATWLPYGSAHVITGPAIDLRFPGQWFQTESGLHQNWMRDFDSTTERCMQPDPLGQVYGPELEGYARQNPGGCVNPKVGVTIVASEFSTVTRAHPHSFPDPELVPKSLQV